MATVQSTKLILKMQAGKTATGTQSYVQRTFANITPTLSDEELYSIGTKLGGLQSAPVVEIRRQDVKALGETA